MFPSVAEPSPCRRHHGGRVSAAPGSREQVPGRRGAARIRMRLACDRSGRGTAGVRGRVAVGRAASPHQRASSRISSWPVSISHSIESVAPALCSRLDHDGPDATADSGVAFLPSATGTISDPDQIDRLRATSLAYCQCGTLAMALVHRALIRLAAGVGTHPNWPRPYLTSCSGQMAPVRRSQPLRSNFPAGLNLDGQPCLRYTGSGPAAISAGWMLN